MKRGDIYQKRDGLGWMRIVVDVGEKGVIYIDPAEKDYDPIKRVCLKKSLSSWGKKIGTADEEFVVKTEKKWEAHISDWILVHGLQFGVSPEKIPDAIVVWNTNMSEKMRGMDML